MSSDPSAVSRKDFDKFAHEMIGRTLHLGLDIKALEYALIDAGVISQQQLDAATKKVEFEAKALIDALTAKKSTLQ